MNEEDEKIDQLMIRVAALLSVMAKKPLGWAMSETALFAGLRCDYEDFLRILHASKKCGLISYELGMVSLTQAGLDAGKEINESIEEAKNAKPS